MTISYIATWKLKERYCSFKSAHIKEISFVGRLSILTFIDHFSEEKSGSISGKRGALVQYFL